ncbi:nucleic acid/nucleotide deaminase domain-containing protein [Aspergillus mulundensis]|uniref:Uncharacterized protein n=1 Tax=Aspergillus mulundensis TaxID=1810919 RepID=A0A3D8SL65_9EURO|nr:Uncharacterized protein DSM5745_03644 [Aspergillus mulundensis]RDW87002.1 Uncharacterized protein DSM5745_03644 [Aspergillus mulundensis]
MPPASSTPTGRPVQTARYPNTIWSPITEDAFRHHLVTLAKQTNAVPMDVLTAADIDHHNSSLFLPLATEKKVADDLAYIAAVTEGAQSVAAVCLEQHIGNPIVPDHPTLAIRVAGMDVINEDVKRMLQATVAELQSHAQPMTLERQNSTETIFRLIVQQHEQKLLGRLRSKKWTKPKHLARTHKKPLWQDFDNLLHRAQHIYPRKSERKTREAIATSVQEIRKLYESFETSNTPTPQALEELVKTTFSWCKAPLLGDYASKLESAGDTRQVAAAIKTLRQLEKIGAYWRIAQDLVTVASRYPHVFRNIAVEYISPYASVPTSIAYESWAHTCHVHAEIQLLVELAKSASEDEQVDAASAVVRPRTIGTSKYLCYLCYLFLRYHGGFQMLSTHGRLYDQWTVPDLAEYDAATRRKFASVLEHMDEHVLQQIQETEAVVWRAEPMTSRQNLLLGPGADGLREGRDVGLDADALEVGVDGLGLS